MNWLGVCSLEEGQRLLKLGIEFTYLRCCGSCNMYAVKLMREGFMRLVVFGHLHARQGADDETRQ